MRLPEGSLLVRSRVPVTALVTALATLAGSGCININTKGYPAVERSDVLPLVAAGGDTAWMLARPPITVVGRSRQSVDVPGGLSGVARSWERMFGAPPGPATVVLVDLSNRGRPASPVALPDSLANRTVVWVPTQRFDDGDRERRDGPPVAGTPVMMGGTAGPASLQLAQAWLDERLARVPNPAAVPAWLRAGLVETLGGSDMPTGMRRRGGDIPRLPLDTILARQCPAEWVPVPRWRPRPAEAQDSASAADRRERRARDIRNGESDPDRAFRERMQAPCGPALRLSAGSFLRFLMERGGDPLANRLLQTYLAGGTLESAVAGAPGLPQTTAELERAWRAWEQERVEDMRRSGG